MPLENHLETCAPSRVALLALVLVMAFGSAPVTVAAAVDFARDIRPILNKNCVGCHGGVKRAGKISFIYRDVVVASNATDDKPIHPGDPEHSEIIRRLTTDNEEDRMPPADHAARLSDRDISLLREWIRQGAKWKEHWAWIKPVAATTPRVSKPKWLRQPLDAFVLARLDTEKLSPSPEADRAQWLRRVSFDLTGLPPAPDEIKAFSRDKSLTAFEKVVDRLLASPRFGERWASPWLDASRHADSMGYENDPLRTVWPFRDWVIRALNEDVPFDQFTIKQLAGDLLPKATLPDQIATTFHRNTQVNTEGGTDDEEFRIAAVIDRVNTTWEVWQGTTMRCAQCHAHPYEPIKHEEFYRSFALFNTTRDWDLPDDSPVLRVPLSETNTARAWKLDETIARLRREDFSSQLGMAGRPHDWVGLAPDKTTATKGTQLTIQTNETGAAEIRTVGTVATFSQFIIEAPLPENLAQLGALRVEVLPEDPESARLTPEKGFVITQLRAALLPPASFTNHAAETSPGSTPSPADNTQSTNAMPGEIKLAHCFGDEVEPLQDDDTAVRPDKRGWGANPRLTQLRRAILVPSELTTVPAGSRLKLVISHDQGANDSAALVTRRLSLAATAKDDWIEFSQNPQFLQRRKEIARLRKERDAIADVKLPVMREQEAAFRRPTAVFERGNWLAKGALVEPGVPQVFKSSAADPGDRLALARWLVSPDNPLTARVTVNRFWSELFGVGLVETVEDFGSSGQPPANQALLDHLALRFQNDLGWSMKRLLRELVLSATYRQDAHTSTTLAVRDPQNRLLARGPRTRLSSEMVRDQALAISGLFSDKMFGPPVMPPQPDGIWDIVYSGAKWETASGEDRHRRALYTILRRTAAYPSFLTFDSPSREVCVTRRIKTNTPLQALVTLNDPVYVECAVALAARMRREAGDDLRKQIARGYELATGRTPAKASLHSLEDLHKTSLARYHANPDLAKKLAGSPAEAALTLVANALLNLDDSLTK